MNAFGRFLLLFQPQRRRVRRRLGLDQPRTREQGTPAALVPTTRKNLARNAR